MAKSVTLTAKHLAFIDAYLIDPNAGAAARKAGYKGTDNALRLAGHKMLKHPLVSAELAKRREVVQAKTDVTVASILERLNAVANRCMQAVPVMHHDREMGGMVQTMVENEDGEMVGLYEFDSGGANRALELMGKHLGMFTDRLKVESNVKHYVVALPARAKSKEDWMKTVKAERVT